jgi:hypothetical protein
MQKLCQDGDRDRRQFSSSSTTALPQRRKAISQISFDK